MVFWFLCLWSVCLFGEAEPNFALSTFGGEPEGIVAGCVNPIAGEYFIKADDLVVTGARPIVLKRITQSRGAIKEHGRWHFVPHLKMTFVDDKRLIEGKDASGSALLFVRQVKKQKIAKIFVRDKLSHQYFIKQSFLRSVTNSSHGEISGRNHIQNYKIVKRKGKFTLFLGDGGERKYRKSKDKKHRKHYYLVREKFLNGDYLRYFYDNRDNLIRIESGHMGTKGIYAWVTFEDFGTYVRVDTSDKQVLFCRGEDYKFEGKEKRFLFNRFVHNQNKEGAEEVSYTTDGLALPLSYRLSSNHFHAIDYYHKGGNGLVLRPGSIDLKWDSMQRKRVLRLKSPVGNTRDLHVTHEFLYHNTLPRDWGVTDLLTPNGHCRAFRYEKATHRLGEVEFWDNFSGGSNNSRVRYSWNDLGYLLNKEILSPPTKRVSAISLEYDDKGNVTKETVHGDVIGNGEESAKVTRYEYGDHFRVKKITHPNGVVETLSYSGSDQITSRAMWHGKEVLKKTSYRYGVRNRLTEVITEGGKDTSYKHIKKTTPHTAAHCIDLPFIEEEFYEEGGIRHLLTKQMIYYNDHLLVTKLDHFDANNQFLFSIEREYDAYRRLSAETDPLGRKRYLTYDPSGNLIRETKFDSPLVYTYMYDCMRRVIAVTETAPDGTTRSAHTRYDLENNPIEKIDMRGHVTLTTFDGNGNPFEETGPDGGVVKRLYNHQGKPLKMIDPLGGETVATYNSVGQITSLTYPNGTTEKKRYTLTGQLERHTTPDGNTLSITYDIQDRPLTKILKDSLGQEVSRETFVYNSIYLLEHRTPSHTLTYTYDGAGRKATETNNGITTVYTYDACGRVCREQTGERFKVTEYDLVGRVIREETNDTTVESHYDRYDKLVTVVTSTPVGPAVRRSEYDDYGRVVAQIDALGNRTLISYRDAYYGPTATVLEKTTMNPRGVRRVETYTPQGKLAHLKVIDWLGGELLEEKYTYDLMGNKIVQESLLPGREVETKWTYDVMGQLIQLDEAGHRTTRFTYDKGGRQIQVVKPGGVVIETVYDALSRAIRVKSSDGTVDYENVYSARGQLLRSGDLFNTYDEYGNLLSESYRNLTNRFTYDEWHRRSSMVLPTGEAIEYEYEGVHLARVKFRGLVHAYHYLENRLDYEELPYGLGRVAYTYNPLLPISVESPYHHQRIHNLDEANNVTLLETGSHFLTYTYDALSQLSSEAGPFNHVYQTDAHYRRLQKDDDDHTYDELNQLLAHINRSYTYTSTGCRASCNETQYTYDALDRLIKIDGPKGVYEFTYDYFNRLITANGEVFLYDGENEIGRFVEGEMEELRILGAPSRSANLSGTILLLLGEEVFIPLHDLYENITHLVSPSGTVVHESLFNPFGEERSTKFSINPWRYQSKRHLGGLVYFGHRFYDIETALFLTPDPAGYSEGPNLYQFVHNNPLCLVDPNGSVLFAPEIFCHDYLNPSNYQYLGPCLHMTKFEDRLWPVSGNYGIRNSFDYKLCKEDHGSPLKELTQKFNVDLHLKDPSRGRVTFINGIDCRLDDGVMNSAHLSKILGCNVHSVYNATHGVVNDLIECALGAARIATAPAILLTKQWENLFSEMKSDQRILHYCHSQGAIHTKLALLLLPPDLRNRIDVVAIAPAQFIPNQLCGSAINYVVLPQINKNPEKGSSKLSFDAVPLLLNYVSKALVIGSKMATMVMAAASCSRIEEDRYNIKFLRSHLDSPAFDHPFTSPTYEDAIKQQGNLFF